jgi:phytol kinase
MFSIVIAISWGIIGEKFVVLAVILAWGVGDAAAALVGKTFGKIYIEGKYVDGKKTFEGSFAMLVASFIVIFIILAINTNLPWYYNVTVSIISAIVNSIVELNTKHGLDTITCPLALVLVMLPLLHLMG